MKAEGRFIFRRFDGPDEDVTDDVGCLYDLVIGSMNWGSGFLTVEDALPVVRIAQLGQFKDWEQAQEYVDAQTQAREQLAFLERFPEAYAVRYPRPGGVPERIEHNHIWSSVGRCMWSGCQERTSERPS